MSDLLAEVDEAMRQERMEKFWHENKTYIIAFIALTILSTAVMSGYRSWDTKTKIKQTEQVIALQEAEDYPANIIDAELKIRPSLRGIAILSAAANFMEQDKPEEAAKLYARLAADTKIPNEFRHLGILMDVRLKMDNTDIQKADLLAALHPILKSKSAWKPHAQIDAALIEADQNPQKSLELLNAVADTAELPESLYERAQKLHHVIAGNIPDNNSAEPQAEPKTN